MNLLKKALIGVGASASMMMSAYAAPVTVGGVTWDPDSALDFSSFSIAIHQSIDQLTGVVSGYGFISTMNGTDQATFCSGCEVTFQFGAFTPISAGAPLPNAPGVSIGYSGGWVKVYVDNSPEITNPSDPTTLTSANTGDGLLWLSLLGHELDGVTLTGTATGVGGVVNALTGGGLLDVVGGAARGNFDTNTQLDGADFSFSNSFTLFRPNQYNAYGTGNFYSNSIPEPGSLALAGLALLGLGAARRRKSAK